jgi:hypothetical protein
MLRLLLRLLELFRVEHFSRIGSNLDICSVSFREGRICPKVCLYLVIELSGARCW